MLSAYKESLKTGEVRASSLETARVGGGSYRFAPESIGGTVRVGSVPALSASISTRPRRTALLMSWTLCLAMLVVVDDDHPVMLRVPINARVASFSHTPLAGASQGRVSTYGLVTGRCKLPRAPPGRPVVPPPRQASRSDEPRRPVRRLWPLRRRPRRPRLPQRRSRPRAPRSSGRPRLRGRVVTPRPRLPGRERPTVRATAKRRVIGTLRKTIPAAGRRKLKPKLKRKPPAGPRLAIAFTPAGCVEADEARDGQVLLSTCRPPAAGVPVRRPDSRCSRPSPRGVIGSQPRFGRPASAATSCTGVREFQALELREAVSGAMS